MQRQILSIFRPEPTPVRDALFVGLQLARFIIALVAGFTTLAFLNLIELGAGGGLIVGLTTYVSAAVFAFSNFLSGYAQKWSSRDHQASALLGGLLGASWNSFLRCVYAGSDPRN
jgi:hypothetical protein